MVFLSRLFLVPDVFSPDHVKGVIHGGSHLSGLVSPVDVALLSPYTVLQNSHRLLWQMNKLSTPALLNRVVEGLVKPDSHWKQCYVALLVYGGRGLCKFHV